jgi:sensory rhodopsin
MQFPQTFVPTARDVGLLPMVTEFSLLAALLAFAGGFVFLLGSRNSVAPWHRSSALLSAVICLVLGASYWVVHNYYHDMLHQLAAITDPAGRRLLIRDAYFAIGAYRYMGWAVAFPLLVLRIVMVLKVKSREIFGWMAWLAGAAFWMVLAAFIGDQQLGPDGAVLAWRHWCWGVGAALGFATILYVIFGKFRSSYGGNADDDAGQAYRWMAKVFAGTWAVYAAGYLLEALVPRLDLNWVQIAFTAADAVTFLGISCVAYLLGTAELERRVPPEAIQPARIVS